MQRAQAHVGGGAGLWSTVSNCVAFLLEKGEVVTVYAPGHSDCLAHMLRLDLVTWGGAVYPFQ